MLIATVQECFDGDVTGSVNITELLNWLENIGRKPEMSAFTVDNCKDLLETHEWDSTFPARIKRLQDLGHRNWKPMIGVIVDGSAYIIDGWHRLAITYRNFTDKPEDVPTELKGIIPFMLYRVTLEECAQFRPAKVGDPGIVQVNKLN